MNLDSHNDKGEDMNVAAVHGALLRELGEPYELFKRVPWYVRHSTIVLFLSSIFYLCLQVYDWNEYEEEVALRYHRDLLEEQVKEPAPEAPPAAQ